MGYEVLDSAGTASSGQRAGFAGSSPLPSPDDGAPAAVDILDLDAPTNASNDPRARRRPTRGALRVAAVVVPSLLVGALAGGLATRHSEEEQQRRARSAVLAATATVTNLAPSDTGTTSVAIITARLLNLGPLPIEVLTTGGARPLGTTVSGVATSTPVDPGDAAWLTVNASLDCGRSDVQDDVTVAVRTADRRVHQVSLQMPFGGGQTLRRAMCDDGNGPPAQATLGSSVNRPVLRLVNNATTDVRFSVATEGALPPAEDGGPVATVTTDPVMPVLVPAGGRRAVRLVVRVRRCIADLALLQNGNYLGLEAVSVSGNSRSQLGIDIGPLVGAAMARTCPS